MLYSAENMKGEKMNLYALIVLYELHDDSLETETYSDVECHLLHWVVFDWRVFIAILREHCNTTGWLGVS